MGHINQLYKVHKKLQGTITVTLRRANVKNIDRKKRKLQTLV